MYLSDIAIDDVSFGLDDCTIFPPGARVQLRTTIPTTIATTTTPLPTTLPTTILTTVPSTTTPSTTEGALIFVVSIMWNDAPDDDDDDYYYYYYYYYYFYYYYICTISDMMYSGLHLESKLQQVIKGFKVTPILFRFLAFSLIFSLFLILLCFAHVLYSN